MDDILETPVVPDIIEEKQVSSEVSSNDALADLAQQYGWNPEKGEKGPKEFIEYALQNLEPRGKELKELKNELTYVRSHIEEQKKAAYQQAIVDMEQRKQAAIAAGDVKAVDAIYEERQKLVAPVTYDPVNEFTSRYEHITKDSSLEAFEIRKFIVERDKDLDTRGLDKETHVKILEADMLKKFPDYFGQSKAKTPVEKDSTSQTDLRVKKKYSYSDLNSVQKDVASYMKAQGHSVDDYIKGLVDSGALK